MVINTVAILKNKIMITEEQYNEAKRLIKQYEIEQLDLLRVMRSKSATTTIPQER